MDWAWNILPYIVPFLVVITVLVFVHELGHYLVARKNGIRVEVFSIGFGPELVGWTDRVGTRWKISLFPLGGYVKMFGDQDASSSRPSDVFKAMDQDSRSETLHGKTPWQRFWVAFAGPLANYFFAFVLFVALFVTVGYRYTPAEISQVLPESPALAAGLKAGDVIQKVDGVSIRHFYEFHEKIQSAAGKSLSLDILRRGAGDAAPQHLTILVTPQAKEVKDNLGRVHQRGVLGVANQSAPVFEKLGVGQAIVKAGGELWRISAGMLEGLGKIVTGEKSTDELGGVLRIAKITGDVAQSGWANLLWIAAFLSINLGLINLLPIPMLDGGQMLFCAIEGVTGRPLSEQAQEIAFRIGFSFVIFLMLLSFWNDLKHLGVVRWVVSLFSKLGV